jgi:hypothetical protein
MGSKFDTEMVKLKKGQNIVEALKNILTEKNMIDRMGGDNGYFFINNITVQSINAGEVLLVVEYEYGS